MKNPIYEAVPDKEIGVRYREVKGQTKLGSVAEAWINVFVGFGISFAANMIIFPWFGFHVHAGQAMVIGMIYTVISLVRSYVLRRIFNRLTVRHGL